MPWFGSDNLTYTTIRQIPYPKAGEKKPVTNPTIDVHVVDIATKAVVTIRKPNSIPRWGQWSTNKFTNEFVCLFIYFWNDEVKLSKLFFSKIADLIKNPSQSAGEKRRGEQRIREAAGKDISWGGFICLGCVWSKTWGVVLTMSPVRLPQSFRKQFLLLSLTRKSADGYSLNFKRNASIIRFISNDYLVFCINFVSSSRW